MAKVYPRERGGITRYYLRYRDLDGVQRETKVASEKEGNILKQQIEEWLANSINPNQAMFTFGQMTEVFFEEHIIPECQWKTQRDYQSAFEKYHLPSWSQTPLRSINRFDIKAHRNAIEKKGISNKRVNNVMVPLKRMFSWALEHGYITDNPCTELKALPVQQEEMRYFTPEQLDDVVAACDVDDGWYRDHIYVLGWTGLRVGELQELRYSDAQWGLGTPKIYVQRAYKGNGIVGLPKSGKTRWVAMSPDVAKVLRRRQDELMTTENDLVFPASDGNRLDEANFRNRVFYPTLVKLGLREPQEKKPRAKTGEGARSGRGYCPRNDKPSAKKNGKRDYRAHDLRHTFAYIYLNRGRGDVYGLKETMGHAQLSTTMRYAHFAPEDAQRIADTLEFARNAPAPDAVKQADDGQIRAENSAQSA